MFTEIFFFLIGQVTKTDRIIVCAPVVIKCKQIYSDKSLQRIAKKRKIVGRIIVKQNYSYPIPSNHKSCIDSNPFYIFSIISKLLSKSIQGWNNFNRKIFIYFYRRKGTQHKNVGKTKFRYTLLDKMIGKKIRNNYGTIFRQSFKCS